MRSSDKLLTTGEIEINTRSNQEDFDEDDIERYEYEVYVSVRGSVKTVIDRPNFNVSTSFPLFKKKGDDIVRAKQKMAKQLLENQNPGSYVVPMKNKSKDEGKVLENAGFIVKRSADEFVSKESRM